MSGIQSCSTRKGRCSTDQATRARKWLSSGLCSFFAGVEVPIPAFLSHYHYSTGRKFSDEVHESTGIWCNAKRGTHCMHPMGRAESTVCESHHSDMLPSWHLHGSQKTCRRWSNCGDGYTKLKSFQSSQASLTEKQRKISLS
jgi:hypothetical protein